MSTTYALNLLEERLRVITLYGYFGLCIQCYNIYICNMRGERLREKHIAFSSVFFSCKPYNMVLEPKLLTASVHP
jgi:hypothetical protein